MASKAITDMVIKERKKEEKRTYLGIKLGSPTPYASMVPTELLLRAEGMLLLRDV
jgi:hypothetical protein